MLSIGSVKEDFNTEKRISVTPETVKKFRTLGFLTNLEKKYAEHLGIDDEEYKKNGAIISATKKEVFEKSDIILKVNHLSENESDLIKSKSIFVAQFDPDLNNDVIKKITKNFFS